MTFPCFPSTTTCKVDFCDPKHNLQLTELIEFHYLELSKFKLQRLEDLSTPLQRWIFFLRYATEYHEVNELPIQLRQEEGITMAYEATHEALCDKEIFYELEARRKFLLDQATNFHAAKVETQKFIASRMRQEGLSRELIATVTELGPAELDEIFLDS